MDNLICSICLESFDSELRIPLVLSCGHTFCKICLEAYKNQPILCPMDRIQELRDIAGLPKNFIVLDLLDEPKFMHKCFIHNKKLKWRCNTDNKDICSECILDHNSHQLSKLVQEEESKEKQIDIIAPIKGKIHITLFNSKIFPNGSLIDIESIILPKNTSAEKSKLLYSLSVDWASNSAFHRKCDGKGATLVIIQLMDNYIFGGYTRVPWGKQVNDRGDNLRDDKAYLFSITDRMNSCKLTLKTEYRCLAVYHHINHGPTFGVGYDLYLNLDKLEDSCSRLEAYTTKKKVNPETFLAGKFNNWQFREIEIYQIS